MKLAIAGLIVGLFGFAVSVLSTDLDYWYSLSNEKGIFYFGLWRKCTSWLIIQKCATWSLIKSPFINQPTRRHTSSIEQAFGGGWPCQHGSCRKHVAKGAEVPSWLQACQGFMVLTDIFIAFGLISFGLFILQIKPKLYLKRISMAFCIASGEEFLDRTVTTDETWLWHFDPETKAQSCVWKTPGTPPPKKARIQKSGRKHMYMFFMDRKGMILQHQVPDGQTVTASYYSKVLRRDLMQALKKVNGLKTPVSFLFIPGMFRHMTVIDIVKPTLNGYRDIGSALKSAVITLKKSD